MLACIAASSNAANESSPLGETESRDGYLQKRVIHWWMVYCAVREKDEKVFGWLGRWMDGGQELLIAVSCILSTTYRLR